MKTGYDQFFNSAKKNATKNGTPRPVQFKKTSTPTPSKVTKKSKPKFPVIQFSIFGLCALGFFAAVEDYDRFENYLSKIEIGVGMAHAETAPELPLAAKTGVAKEGESHAAEQAPAATTTAASTKVEDSDYLFKLAERKKELDAREEDLNKKSTEIAKQKEEIDQKLRELEQYRTKISSLLQERISSDSGKIDTLVQVYSNMKPSQAAKIFESMDEDLVIEILGRMKKKNAADIMNLVKAEKAQVFAERYAGYRMPSSKKSEKTEMNETETKPNP